MATTVAFRALDDAGKLPDNYVNPYYLEDLKRRVSVARVCCHSERSVGGVKNLDRDPSRCSG